MTPTRRGTPDFLLLFLTFCLVCFGLAFVFSSSMAYEPGEPWHFALRQAVSIVIGAGAMLFCMNIEYRKFQKLVPPYIIIVIILLLLVPVFGTERNGAQSWLYIFGFGLQPTEFAKVGLIVYLASMISRKDDKIQDFSRGLMPPVVVTGFFAALVMLQPDMGSTLVMTAGALIIIIAGGARWKHLLLLGSAGAVLLSFVILILFVKTGGQMHYFDRFRSYLDPWSDASDTGWQMVQSLYAFSHGGWFGAGFGQSIQKLHYLPEAHNDFIFAIIGEELGFVGTAFFLLLYLAFLWRGFVVALRAPDTFSTLTGIGIMGMIGVQAFVNLGGVTGAIPLTGVTLPLISQGGSSMMSTLMGLGILLSISREYNKPDKPSKKAATDGHRKQRWIAR